MTEKGLSFGRGIDVSVSSAHFLFWVSCCSRLNFRRVCELFNFMPSINRLFTLSHEKNTAWYLDFDAQGQDAGWSSCHEISAPP